MEILYIDRYLVAVDKPTGIVSESTENGDGLPDLLTKQLRADGKMRAQDRLYPVHRLDKAVGGAMLLARDGKAAALMSKEVAERRVGKEYVAVVHSRPSEASGEMFDLLYHDKRVNKSYVVDRMRGGVRDASLEYCVLSSADTESGELTKVKIVLRTGRTHQIRVQFASRGLPLWGDVRYGLREKGGLALRCHRIAFVHPYTHENIDIVSELPDVFPWTLYNM